MADQTAMFPLSGTHYIEISEIADPAQRQDLTAVMEELSEFRVMLGRPTIMRLEIQAALHRILGVDTQEPTVALFGNSFAWAFGMRGGLRILGADGQDLTDARRDTDLYRQISREFERGMLAGPADDEAAQMRLDGHYRPELVRATAERRAEQEREQAARLDAEPRWRRGRLRDVISARELTLEWSDPITEALIEAGTTISQVFGTDRNAIRSFADGMPSNCVAVSLKTHYHRDRQHLWTVNDIEDIDALSAAVPYCDAVLTDKAARNAIVTTKVDQQAGTFMPRTARDLADWLIGG
ncbi:hypothetical protein [Klenkia sp. PcliD-1-E]|uniref:hypothetical protein n=1 Tax=Klenkia sp. PcliD-1-E TaxID=2954492 RepID=UPI00209838C3|nr:hypothetical protein [Klenkia sp. PcliD-1-E]MCO7219244.1 hypothetical protein [Klenkia sp. PcliD-1-E]